MKQKEPPPAEYRRRFSLVASEIASAVTAGDVARAARLSELALREGFIHPIFLNLVAYREIQEGNPAKALELLADAKAMAPGDLNIVNAIGTCHAALGDLPAALQAYDLAISGAPELAPAYYNRGVVHDALGDFARARTDFERAVALQPGYPEALARLAYAAASRGAHATARDYAGRALKHDPAQFSAVLAYAISDIAERRFVEAEQFLSVWLPDPRLSSDNRAIALSLIGDARDGAGDPAGAFDAYSRSNVLLQSIYRAKMEEAAPESPRRQVERLRSHFAATSQETWSVASALVPPERSAPVFLVGFPRSGTTLLEQALAGHPGIATSEEREFLIDAAADFIVPPQGLARLESLTTEAAARYRAAYWKRAAATAPEGKLLIDKLPLNTLFLPLIRKLFPDAKIVFALRDPRDVVFSCFRRRFAMTPQMYEFLTLEGAAGYYDAVMHLAQRYRDTLGLATKYMVYEEVVSDFEGQVRDLCGFLGLQWHSAIGDFAARLAARGVDTPSSGQLVKGLNREGVGAWRRYHQQMRPVLNMLAPWVERFGYTEE